MEPIEGEKVSLSGATMADVLAARPAGPPIVDGRLAEDMNNVAMANAENEQGEPEPGRTVRMGRRAALNTRDDAVREFARDFNAGRMTQEDIADAIERLQPSTFVRNSDWAPPEGTKRQHAERLAADVVAHAKANPLIGLKPHEMSKEQYRSLFPDKEISAADRRWYFRMREAIRNGEEVKPEHAAGDPRLAKLLHRKTVGLSNEKGIAPAIDAPEHGNSKPAKDFQEYLSPGMQILMELRAKRQSRDQNQAQNQAQNQGSGIDGYAT